MNDPFSLLSKKVGIVLYILKQVFRILQSYLSFVSSCMKSWVPLASKLYMYDTINRYKRNDAVYLAHLAHLSQSDKVSFVIA